MPNRIRKWIDNQKQTRKFHPLWILAVVLTTAIVGGIIWIPAELIARKAEYERLPTAAGPPAAVEEEQAPAEDPGGANIRQPAFPTWDREKIIRVTFSPPLTENPAGAQPDTGPAPAAPLTRT